MADRLSLYNGALLKLGQPRLSALTDEGKGRRALDACYDKVIKRCLEGGFWNFALRFVQFTSDPSYNSEYGYQKIFAKPDDWLRTAGVTFDGHGRSPLLDYDDRQDFWLADVDPIYVRYVSNDVAYGMDLGRWPENYATFVEYDLAHETCEEITGSAEKKQRLEKDRETAGKRASNTDAMNEPVTRFAPPGRLVQSRGNWSRGSSGAR
ncbi:MAG TPA: hypothetical protein VGX71_13615 [Pseudaminobacter sp.]|nr:hypothetical protein [Pseudaminobacter sp.]